MIKFNEQSRCKEEYIKEEKKNVLKIDTKKKHLTALHLECAKKRPNIEVVKALLKKG